MTYKDEHEINSKIVSNNSGKMRLFKWQAKCPKEPDISNSTFNFLIKDLFCQGASKCVRWE